jgi:hypothetical protein
VVSVDKRKVAGLLKLSVKHGFLHDEKETESLLKSDMFRLRYQPTGQNIPVFIDCMLAGIEYQNIALKRRKKIEAAGAWLWFAAPEDIVIFKLLSYRGRDQSDIVSIIFNQGNRLDIDYMNRWAEKFELGKELRLCLKEAEELSGRSKT